MAIEVAERVLEYIKEIRRSGINCEPRKLQKYLNHNFDLEIGRDRLFTLMGKMIYNASTIIPTT